jgi:hypothetical protein
MRWAMKKAAPSILIAVLLLAFGVITEAQQPKKVSRIGYLAPSVSPNTSQFEAFLRVCVTSATSREKILSLNGELTKEN